MQERGRDSERCGGLNQFAPSKLLSIRGTFKTPRASKNGAIGVDAAYQRRESNANFWELDYQLFRVCSTAFQRTDRCMELISP